MINFGLDSVDLIYHKHGIQIPNPCQKTSQIERKNCWKIRASLHIRNLFFFHFLCGLCLWKVMKSWDFGSKWWLRFKKTEIGPKQFLELLQSWVASRQTCRTTPQPWTTIPCVLMPSSHFLSTVSTAEAKQQPLNGMMQNSTWSTKLFY